MKNDLDAQFRAFHRDNPHVLAQLESLAWQAHRKGQTRIGMGMLFEVLRWQRIISTTDPDFKLNNNYRSRYARLIMRRHPVWADGLFETRTLR